MAPESKCNKDAMQERDVRVVDVARYYLVVRLGLGLGSRSRFSFSSLFLGGTCSCQEDGVMPVPRPSAHLFACSSTPVLDTHAGAAAAV